MKLVKKFTALAIVVMLVFSMCVTSVSFAAEQTSAKQTLYLKPSTNWTQQNARFAMYVWNGTGATNTWISMTDKDKDGYYEAEFLAGAWENVIFCRMNPNTTDNSWGNKWAQTVDLVISSTDNCYTITNDYSQKCSGIWSKYSPVTTEPSTTQPATTEVATTVVTEPATTQPVVPYRRILIGDVNLNDKVTIQDASVLQKYLAESVVLNEDALIAADTNKDGSVSISDVTNIQKYLAERTGYEYVGQYIEIGQPETTEEPTTVEPTTEEPTTVEPTTVEPTTVPVTEPTTAPQEAKKTAFTGNTIWVDTAENPENSSSTLPLVKAHNKSYSSYYFYLPGTANIKSLPVYFSGYSSVKIGNNNIVSGNRYSFTSETSYDLYLNGSKNGTVKFYVSTSPAMYLNTTEKIPTNTYASTSLGSLSNKENLTTSGTIGTDEIGKDYKEGKLKKLKGRGNSSWSASYEKYGKYSFNITLDKKTKLFSTMNEGKKYCLLANNVDESYLRNVYSFELAKQLNCDFTPTFQYVDLYDNGSYIGSYLATDKIEINAQSCNLGYSLEDLNETANPGVDIEKSTRRSTGSLYDTTTKGYKKWVDINDPTVDKNGNPMSISNGDGSYLLEFELCERFGDEISGFISNKGQQVVVKTPEIASKAQVDYVSSLFNKAESVVYNSGSSLADIEKVIDVESFVKVYLIQELSENVDACATSYYVYIDSKVDNRLHAAPVWDYDWAYGQYGNTRQIASSTYASPANTSQWYAKFKEIYANKGGVTGTKNFQSQVANSAAWSKVVEIWKDTNGFYNTAKNITNGSSSTVGSLSYYINSVEGSAKMNESRWGFISSNPLSSWGSADTGSNYNSTTSFLKNWLNNRLNWMNNNVR